MDQRDLHILTLLEKLKEDTLSQKEVDELDLWYESFKAQPLYTAGLSDVQQYDAREKLLRKIDRKLDQHKPSWLFRSTTIQIWTAAAAILLILLSIPFYFYLNTANFSDKNAQAFTKDLLPGGNKATLTLSNGTQIVLSDVKNGLLATQGDALINKTENGTLVYDPGQTTNTTTSLTYNTMSTPRGGQYHLTLADGTNVWLNAASSIRYPATFPGHERLVEITGEVYFEVSHDAAKPFRVKSAGQTVEVLGTHFNINAYKDEPVTRTSLLEGSVSIQSNKTSVLIKPGQQAVLAQGNFKLMAVDEEDVLSWKEGLFRFNDESLESIMRKISRWYNVDIEYSSSEIKQLPMTGIITHFSSISKVLRMLELTNQVHFEITENKIIVHK